jgi:pimeloyl-ACP methyl ester carboxylesterase
MKISSSLTSLRYLLCIILIAIIFPGCPVNLNQVPGTTELLTDAETGNQYYLYVPSWHNNEKKWPVIVTCHGTNPFDTAWAQIHEWRALAERYGLLVVAPVLKGTDSQRTLLPEDQIARQRQDEKTILSIVQRTINSLNGDPARVYMVGWSGGAYAVYYTGLRHPKVFRALAVRMGSYDEKFLPDVIDRLDPYQPISIFMASDDLPGITPQCRAAAKWLKEHGMKRVHLREVAGTHERKPEMAFDFFWDVTKRYSYVRINVIKDVANDPLTTQFYADVDPSPAGVIWDFGDGELSKEVSPQHRYAQAGTYQIKLTVINNKAAKTERTLTLSIGN